MSLKNLRWITMVFIIFYYFYFLFFLFLRFFLLHFFYFQGKEKLTSENEKRELLMKYPNPPETLSRAEQFLHEVSYSIYFYYFNKTRKNWKEKLGRGVKIAIYHSKHQKQTIVIYVLFRIHSESGRIWGSNQNCR